MANCKYSFLQVLLHITGKRYPTVGNMCALIRSSSLYEQCSVLSGRKNIYSKQIANVCLLVGTSVFPGRWTVGHLNKWRCDVGKGRPLLPLWFWTSNQPLLNNTWERLLKRVYMSSLETVELSTWHSTICCQLFAVFYAGKAVSCWCLTAKCVLCDQQKLCSSILGAQYLLWWLRWYVREYMFQNQSSDAETISITTKCFVQST